MGGARGRPSRVSDRKPSRRGRRAIRYGAPPGKLTSSPGRPWGLQRARAPAGAGRGEGAVVAGGGTDVAVDADVEVGQRELGVAAGAVVALAVVLHERLPVRRDAVVLAHGDAGVGEPVRPEPGLDRRGEG